MKWLPHSLQEGSDFIKSKNPDVGGNNTHLSKNPQKRR
jgi:hypothetical protein